MFHATTASAALLRAAEEPAEIDINPVNLVLGSSGPVLAVLVVLVIMAIAGWVIAILKALQLMRMRDGLHDFEKQVFNLVDAKDLFTVAQRNQLSPGARVVLALSKRGGSAKVIESIAKRAIVDETQRGGSLLTPLASIASSAPFIGLFGTVWGIVNAFLRIAGTGDTSLRTVAPAIGEALIATAIGLLAAIPALVFYNLLNRRLEDLVSELEAASEAWVTIVVESDQKLSIPPDKTSMAQGRPPSASQTPGSYGSFAGG